MHFHLPKPMHGWREFAGEVGVIVLGVLIALGGEQLVQWAHDRNKQHEMLERLFEESRLNVAQLRDRRPAATAFAKEARFATELTKDHSCPPAEEWAALSSTGFYPQTTLRTSVYDEVIGAGGLAEIASPRARDAVAGFHSALGWVQAQTDFFRSTQTTAVDGDDPRVREIYDPEAAEPSITTYDRDALCGDPRFRNRVVEAVRNHVVWDSFRERLTEAAIGMCAVLGRELGRECTPAEGPQFTDTERRTVAEALAER